MELGNSPRADEDPILNLIDRIYGAARIEVQQGITLDGPPFTSVELSLLEMDADGRGFVINGVSAYDRSGFSVRVTMYRP